TLLAGGRPFKVRLTQSQELALELVHPSRCEQHRGIISGNQHVTRPPHTAFGFKEGQILSAQLITGHVRILRRWRRHANRVLSIVLWMGWTADRRNAACVKFPWRS